MTSVRRTLKIVLLLLMQLIPVIPTATIELLLFGRSQKHCNENFFFQFSQTD